jgi:hypothetical protein
MLNGITTDAVSLHPNTFSTASQFRLCHGVPAKTDTVRRNAGCSSIMRKWRCEFASVARRRVPSDTKVCEGHENDANGVKSQCYFLTKN